MKKYQVKITDKALADMEEIYNYIASNLQSPDTAMRQYNRIAADIEWLDTFQERCRLFDSEPECSYGMRQLLGGQLLRYLCGRRYGSYRFEGAFQFFGHLRQTSWRVSILATLWQQKIREPRTYG